jgi:hypothetical protein
MGVLRVVFAGLALLSAISSAAQSAMSADEKQIRDLVTAIDSGQRPPFMTDAILWSGALKRPIVGNERGEAVPGPGSLSNRVPNTTRMTTTIRKIEVAKAGDLAYEFSDAVVAFDAQGGVKTSFPTSLLRVWKKDAGEWKLAAFFIRPHDTDDGD